MKPYWRTMVEYRIRVLHNKKKRKQDIRSSKKNRIRVSHRQRKQEKRSSKKEKMVDSAASEYLVTPSTSMAKEEADAGEGRKTLYIFMYHEDPVIGQSLFAVDIPSPLPPSPSTASPTYPDISPILEFPKKEFPISMHCVQLGSKLYFIGGFFWETKIRYGYKYREIRCARDVYIFDTATAATITTITTTSNASALLSKGKPMKSAKPEFASLAFSAWGKIYVVSTPPPPQYGIGTDETVYFEAFDPMLDEWTALPPPTGYGVFQEQIVIGRKLVFMTEQDRFCCFDLDKNMWASYDKYLHVDFRPLFVEDTVYEPHPETVSKYDPFDHLSHRRIMYLSPDVMEKVDHPCGELHPSCFLFHLGKWQFCHISTGSSPVPDCDENYLNISIFVDLQENYIADHCTYFKGKSLYRQHYLIRTSWYNDGGIVSCFCVSSAVHMSRSDDGARIDMLSDSNFPNYSINDGARFETL